jgi:hypothetical protein
MICSNSWASPGDVLSRASSRRVRLGTLSALVVAVLDGREDARDVIHAGQFTADPLGEL